MWGEGDEKQFTCHKLDTFLLFPEEEEIRKERKNSKAVFHCSEVSLPFCFAYRWNQHLPYNDSLANCHILRGSAQVHCIIGEFCFCVCVCMAWGDCVMPSPTGGCQDAKIAPCLLLLQCWIWLLMFTFFSILWEQTQVLSLGTPLQGIVKLSEVD